VIHEQAWRGIITAAEGAALLGAVDSAPVAVRRPRGLRGRAWEVADRMGWAKTYDAEYCALAELLGVRLVTSDGRLRASGARLGYVETLGEAAARLGG
jgi:predicted nucleic acid-binding protein